MTKKVAVFAFVLLALFAQSANTAPLDGGTIKPKKVADLKGAQGDIYELRLTYDLRHGLATFIYDFGKQKDFKEIYKGRTFGDGEKCPDKKITGIKINKAILKHTFLVKDVNSDAIDDLNLSIIEQDCNTKEITFIEKLLLSTQKGFELKQLQQKVK